MIPSPNIGGTNPPEPVQTGAHTFEQVWLNVGQAVVRCAERGLTRTPKTLRKWAERSFNIGDGDVTSRKEDTSNGGYRWLIEETSLHRKIDEELELRAANPTEPVQTGSHPFAPKSGDQVVAEPEQSDPNLTELVRTLPNQFDQDEVISAKPDIDEPNQNPSEPVRTGSDMEMVLDEVRERMSDKDNEIAFLRGQLADAQTEIGRRAASTDEALKTIDRVVRSFEMQAEANKALALRGSEPSQPFEETNEPVRFAREGVDNVPRHQDIRRV